MAHLVHHFIECLQDLVILATTARGVTINQQTTLSQDESVFSC
jgi:hypothetical protein